MNHFLDDYGSSPASPYYSLKGGCKCDHCEDYEERTELFRYVDFNEDEDVEMPEIEMYLCENCLYNFKHNPKIIEI